MEERNGVTNYKQQAASSVYRGVRKRKWGKWVSEVREPGKKTRIWLGSFETSEMAALAHDAVVFYLRGKAAQLNFPHLANKLPRPASSSAEDIRLAAQEASGLLMLLNNNSSIVQLMVDQGGSSKPTPTTTTTTTVELSPVQIQAIHDLPLDSPEYKNWPMEIDTTCYGSTSLNDYDQGFEEVPDDNLWD